MAVRKFYSTKAKAGWRFDAKTEKFWSYGFDIRLENGKRKRESGFANKRYFPLIDIVKKVLAEAVAIKANGFIFSQKGTLTETYYGQIKAACASAGIIYGRKVRRLNSL